MKTFWKYAGNPSADSQARLTIVAGRSGRMAGLKPGLMPEWQTRRLVGLLSLALLSALLPSGLLHAQAVPPSAVAATAQGKLPPLPAGRPTVIGGTIEQLDPVRDRFMLHIFGGQTLPVLYDPRTTVFRDGVPQSLFSLKNQQQASVETVLEGTAVFAISIHTLEAVQSGECQGQVVSVDASLGEIRVRCGLSPNPLVFRLGAGATIVRNSLVHGVPPAPASAQDIVAGSLVSLHFSPASGGKADATAVALLASPGTPYAFAGALTFLDRHDGRMTIQTSSGESYSLTFTPNNFPPADRLQVGDQVQATAVFDGTAYRAQDVELR